VLPTRFPNPRESADSERSERGRPSPSLFNTTSNILHHDHAESETIYADDAPTHRFRLAVAAVAAELHRFRLAVAAVVAELGWNGRAFGLGLSNLTRIWISHAIGRRSRLGGPTVKPRKYRVRRGNSKTPPRIEPRRRLEFWRPTVNRLPTCFRKFFGSPAGLPSPGLTVLSLMDAHRRG
jgi:hypothetical protein